MNNNYYYSFWPGAYSFKNEIALFIVAIQDKLNEILNKINETDNVTVQ